MDRETWWATIHRVSERHTQCVCVSHRHNCVTETTHKNSERITSLSFYYSLLLAMPLRLFTSFISRWWICYNGVRPAQCHGISKSQTQKASLRISVTPICLSSHFSNRSSQAVCIRSPARDKHQRFLDLEPKLLIQNFWNWGQRTWILLIHSRLFICSF